ncbi:uncharacterized protein Dmoj_GI25822 [Drosophila mojavensis]|uniref:Transposase IS30-like HTH domain-containing protein n=1 Tax=Drosophila mojavensis TaxID=7230 RepID=A0A0Q9XTK4_DROMO|nr:uncharacterized protein Dmoj_GI25822 [Drosophila mojavensis]
MKQTSPEERKLAIFHHNNGKSYAEVADILNRPRSTIQYIIKRNNKDNAVLNKVPAQSNRKLAETDERWIIRQINDNPFKSGSKIKNEPKIYLQKDISDSTVRRVLRSNGYHGRIASNKPYINKRNRQKRLHFDESKYNKHTVWRKPNKEMDVANLRPTVKNGGGSSGVQGDRAGPNEKYQFGLKNLYI